MTLIPWEDLDETEVIPEPFRDGLGLVRDAYCELGDRVPVFRALPLNSFIRRRACGDPPVPTDGGRLGQCDGVKYGFLVEIAGTLENGEPAVNGRDFAGVRRVYGPIGDFRLTPGGSSNSPRWNVDVFARTSMTQTEPFWIRLGAIGGLGGVAFDTTMPAEIINVQVTATEPDDVDLDACRLPPAPEDEVEPGVPIVTIDFNPTLDISLPAIIAPVVIAPVVVAPRFEIQMGDDNSISVDFTLEGIVIDDSNTIVDVDVDNSQVLNEISNVQNNLTQIIDNSSQTVNNNTNQKVTELGDDVNQISVELGDLRTEISNDFSTELSGQLAVSIPTNLDAYFEDNPITVDVPDFDYDRIAEIIDGLPDYSLELTAIDESVTDIQTQIDVEIMPALEGLDESLDDLEDELDCLIAAQPGDWSFLATTTLLEWTATPSDNVRVVSIPASCGLVLLEVIAFDPGAVRTYKLSGNDTDAECGFGHYSIVQSGGACEDFHLFARQKHSLRFPLEREANSPGGVLVSIKPGITVRITGTIYEFQPFSCD